MQHPGSWLPLVLAALVVACAPGPAPPKPGSVPAPASPVVAGGAERRAAEPGGSPTPLPRRHVKVAYPSASLAQMDFMYAEDAGIYTRYGLDIEGVLILPTPASAALVNDELQYINASSTLLMMAAKGLPIRSFLQGWRGPTLELYARPEITSFADLRGKTVITLTPAGLTKEVTLLLIEKHGVNPREVEYVAAGTTPAQMEQLRQGVGVATPLPAPWTIVAQREGYRRLANIGAEIPYPFGLFATTTARLGQEPAEVQAMIRGTLDAHRLLREERADVIAWIARRFEVEPEVAAESYELLVPLLNEGGEVPRDAVANYFGAQEEQPELRNTRYEDVVDPRPLQAVRQETGRR
jgi:ABC-type nitrate/sulfonate/bicarbonate transport system substrate-binding protein